MLSVHGNHTLDFANVLQYTLGPSIASRNRTFGPRCPSAPTKAYTADSTSPHFKYNVLCIRYREKQHDWQHGSAFHDYRIAHESIAASTKQ